jgi:hypothetical protein
MVLERYQMLFHAPHFCEARRVQLIPLYVELAACADATPALAAFFLTNLGGCKVCKVSGIVYYLARYPVSYKKFLSYTVIH